MIVKFLDAEADTSVFFVDVSYANLLCERLRERNIDFRLSPEVIPQSGSDGKYKSWRIPTHQVEVGRARNILQVLRDWYLSSPADPALPRL